MIQVFVKEFNSFLNSLIAYIVIGSFLTGIGLLMWVFPETSVLDYGSLRVYLFNSRHHYEEFCGRKKDGHAGVVAYKTIE